MQKRRLSVGCLTQSFPQRPEVGQKRHIVGNQFIEPQRAQERAKRHVRNVEHHENGGRWSNKPLPPDRFPIPCRQKCGGSGLWSLNFFQHFLSATQPRQREATSAGALPLGDEPFHRGRLAQFHGNA